VDYRQVCKAAIARGIIVNTIHCGGEQEGIDGQWKDGAVRADGRYLNINHNQQVAHIPAPQDREIAELGLRLNTTYIPYGVEGQAAQERQIAQDNNAALLSPQAGLGRAVTKSSRNYTNSLWDLVDAVRGNHVDLGKVAKKDLPESMQEMDAQQREAYVTAKAAERAEIQAKIQTLNEQRSQFIAQERKNQGRQNDTLGFGREADRARAGGTEELHVQAGRRAVRGRRDEDRGDGRGEAVDGTESVNGNSVRAERLAHGLPQSRV
jgi:hypothetical protein